LAVQVQVLVMLIVHSDRILAGVGSVGSEVMAREGLRIPEISNEKGNWPESFSGLNAYSNTATAPTSHRPLGLPKRGSSRESS